MTRIFDLVVSICALVILSPVLVIIAVLVKVDSKGPALFRQERVGRGGALFHIVKFRTMQVQAAAASNGPLVTSDQDPRITRLGRALRSSKLDEIPQFFNVVRGDMALVGPRPEVARYVAEWSAEQRREVLSVRPGITDAASVQFRREAELLAEQTDPETYYRTELLPIKAELYVSYVRSRSFLGDIKILFATIRSVLAR